MNELSVKLTKAVNLDDFQDWLETKPARSIVGYAASPKSCPIANYCNDVIGNPDFHPHVSIAGVYNNSPLIKNLLTFHHMPIATFIGMVDSIEDEATPDDVYIPVTKEQALSFIHTIKGDC